MLVKANKANLSGQTPEKEKVTSLTNSLQTIKLEQNGFLLSTNFLIKNLQLMAAIKERKKYPLVDIKICF